MIDYHQWNFGCTSNCLWFENFYRMNGYYYLQFVMLLFLTSHNWWIMLFCPMSSSAMIVDIGHGLKLEFFYWTWSKTWSALIQLMKTWSTPAVLSRLDNVFNLYVFYMLFLYLSKREIVLASLGEDWSHDPSLFMLLSSCGTPKNTVTCVHLMRFFIFESSWKQKWTASNRR